MGSNGLILHSWDIRLDNETKKLFLINSTEKSLNPWNVPVDIIILIKLCNGFSSYVQVFDAIANS